VAKNSSFIARNRRSVSTSTPIQTPGHTTRFRSRPQGIDRGAWRPFGCPSETGGRVRASERVDRDEVFLEVTRSICPVCKRVLDAEVNA